MSVCRALLFPAVKAAVVVKKYKKPWNLRGQFLDISRNTRQSQNSRTIKHFRPDICRRVRPQTFAYTLWITRPTHPTQQYRELHFKKAEVGMNDEKVGKKRFWSCHAYPQPTPQNTSILLATNKLKTEAEKQLLSCKLLVQYTTF